MKIVDLKLTRIGNSKGVRLPVELIKRYGFSESLAAEMREEDLLLKPKMRSKLSWAETAHQMAASHEDWREWESTMADGLETCPWDEAPQSSSETSLKKPLKQKRRAKKAR